MSMKRQMGTSQRPRASVFKGHASISVQLIDDTCGRTLLVARGLGGKGSKVDTASAVGRDAGQRALAVGIQEVIFDRSGYRYHGRVKAVAEGMREVGLKL